MDQFAGMVIAERYALEQELGRGGMATVWRARDVRHERPVAIKILHPELAGAIGVERFVREVRLTARLQHPNIVAVLDSGLLPATGGAALPWFAMMYLEGDTPTPVHTAVSMGGAYAALHDANQAVAWLSRVETPGSLHFQLHLRCDPPFDPIKGDPRFRALLTVPAPPPGQGC